MGQKLSPNENELYKRCDEVLYYLWDPIGVCGCAAARDEYYDYLPELFALVRDRADEHAIADYLLQVERGMGMGTRPERAQDVASLLIDFREWIDETKA